MSVSREWCRQVEPVEDNEDAAPDQCEHDVDENEHPDNDDTAKLNHM